MDQTSLIQDLIQRVQKLESQPTSGAKQQLTYPLDSVTQQILNDSVSTASRSGSIVFWPLATVPSWAVEADGSNLDRNRYSGIYAVYGTTYGSGDGSTTFGIPDLRGYVPVGYKSGDAFFGTVGGTVGEQTHTLTVSELPTFTPAIYTGNTGSGHASLSVAGTTTASATTGYADPIGGGGYHNNIQPSFIGKWIIVK